MWTVIPFFPEVWFRSRLTGTFPVTTDWVFGDNLMWIQQQQYADMPPTGHEPRNVWRVNVKLQSIGHNKYRLHLRPGLSLLLQVFMA